MSRAIFHLDMDAFYASIEQRDHPSLKGKPVIVGGSPEHRGVVCAASYEARTFGVRSAMPSSIAARLCPEGIFLRPRMDRYQAESRNIMRLLQDAGAVIEKVSIDEAYLELTEVLGDGLGQDPDEILYRSVPLAKELKNRIWSNSGLTASIGIAANKLLAKLGSDFKKPDGLTLIPERDKAAFLRPLPVRAINGVGRVTEQALKQAGIETIADLQDHPGDLRALVGSWGVKLRDYSFGNDNRPLELGDEIKSISSEETFDRDTDDRGILRSCLYAQAKNISSRLVRKRLGARTVQVKVRYADFTTLTRQLSFEELFTETRDIYRSGCFLLGREKLVNRPLRLLGLGVSGLAELGAQQLAWPW